MLQMHAIYLTLIFHYHSLKIPHTLGEYLLMPQYIHWQLYTSIYLMASVARLINYNLITYHSHLSVLLLVGIFRLMDNILWRLYFILLMSMIRVLHVKIVWGPLLPREYLQLKLSSFGDSSQLMLMNDVILLCIFTSTCHISLSLTAYYFSLPLVRTMYIDFFPCYTCISLLTQPSCFNTSVNNVQHVDHQKLNNVVTLPVHKATTA